MGHSVWKGSTLYKKILEKEMHEINEKIRVNIFRNFAIHGSKTIIKIFSKILKISARILWYFYLKQIFKISKIDSLSYLFSPDFSKIFKNYGLSFQKWAGGGEPFHKECLIYIYIQMKNIKSNPKIIHMITFLRNIGEYIKRQNNPYNNNNNYYHNNYKKTTTVL